MALINNPVKLLNELEIKELRPNFTSITKSTEFNRALSSHEAFSKCLNESMFTSKKRGVLFAFQKCLYRVFKSKTDSTLHLKPFCVLFDMAFTIENLHKFLSHEYEIVFSDRTNQFGFIYTNSVNFASENQKIWDALNRPLEDQIYVCKSILSRQYDCGTKRKRDNLQLENDYKNSTTTSLIEEELAKMPFKKRKALFTYNW